MDRTVAARKLIAELVKAGQVEVRRVEVVGRDLVKLCEELKRPPTGAELGEWLDEHAQVSELCAPTNLLDELVDRYLAPPVETVEPSRNAELEKEIREAPGTTGPYLVYADWLQERGDPIGELIALGVAAAAGDEGATARFERHLKRHEAYLLGGVPQLDRVALRWRNGFVQAIEERADADALAPRAWAQLLRLRVCELVESITLRRPVAHELETAIVEAAPPSLRSLALENLDGALPATLLQLPLRSLAVHAATRYGLAITGLPAGLERLRIHALQPTTPSPPLELSVRDLGVALTHDQVVTFLAGARLPQLDTLRLELAADTTGKLPALLAGLDAPALRRLTLCGAALPIAMLAAVAELPLAARTTHLGLVAVELGDEQVAALAAPLRAFTNLVELDLGSNELTREGIAAASQLAPSVLIGRQDRRGAARERRAREFAGAQLQAAEAIADPKAWKRAFVDGDLRWARYRGEAEYELFVSADLARFGCSCPSTTQPCKHVAALALLAERTPFPSAPSNRIEDRVGRRLADILAASIDADR